MSLHIFGHSSSAVAASVGLHSTWGQSFVNQLLLLPVRLASLLPLSLSRIYTHKCRDLLFFLLPVAFYTIYTQSHV